jgi:hypothetical protein
MFSAPDTVGEKTQLVQTGLSFQPEKIIAINPDPSL